MIKLITLLGFVSTTLTTHAGTLAFGTEKNNYARSSKIIATVITKKTDETMIAISSDKGSCLIFQKDPTEALLLLTVLKQDDVTLICENPTDIMNVITTSYRLEYSAK
ncbi:MAG: hypothetical protein WA160_01610 [Pseudobdellovibrio sp.]